MNNINRFNSIIKIFIIFFAVIALTPSIANAITVSISDVAKYETIGNMTFTVTITDGIVSGTAEFDYATVDGSATTGDNDYSATTGTVTFNNGDTVNAERPFNVPITGDNKVEADETFTVTLTPQGADTVTGSPATGTIKNLNSAEFTIKQNESGNEDAGTGVTFTIELSNPVDEATSVTVSTTDISATAGSDYTALTNSVVNFAAGSQSETFLVEVTADSTVEATEQFRVKLDAGSVTGGYGWVTASVNTRFGTITNDDSAEFTIKQDESGNEDAGTAVTFTIELSNPVDEATSVTVSTTDGTANAGSDYTGLTNFVVNFAAGSTSETFLVDATADNTVEADETFTVALGAVTGGHGSVTASATTRTGTITNDDAATFAINDVTHNEGNTGGTTYTFTVTLTGNVDQSVTVNYATADGTATTADSDYTAASDTLTFAGTNGETETFNVTVTGDTKVETDETFTVGLSNVVAGGKNVTISDASGTGTINNDDNAALSIDDVTVTEGNSGTITATFTVSIDGGVTSHSDITFDYATADSSATAPGDYVAITATTGTITAGNSLATIDVTVNGDFMVEGDEQYFVNLTNPSGATITDAQGVGTISDNDTATVSIFGGNAAEPASDGQFSLMMTNVSDTDTVISYNITGDATPDSDYTALSGSVTILADTTTALIDVEVIDDDLVENDEKVIVTLTGITSGHSDINVDTTPATVTIADDTDEYKISIDDITVTEGATAQFTVSLHQEVLADQEVKVDYITNDGTATAGDDYTAHGPTTLTFSAGQQTKTIDVVTLDDDLVEDQEDYTVDLSGVVGNATITDNQGEGYIDDDGDTYGISISDAVPLPVVEPAGTAVVTFTVTLDQAVIAGAADVTVDYATADGSATAGSDYTAKSSTLSYAPGEDQKTFTVDILPDALYEIDETFVVNLSNPTAGGAITDGQGTCTIQDDGDTYNAALEASKSVDEDAGAVTFTVTLDQQVPGGATIAYTTVDTGSAAAGSDYVTASGYLTYAAHETEKDITITILNDEIVERPDETFRVTITPGANQTVSGTSATCTITDNDFEIVANANPNGSITPSGSIGVENGTDQTFNIDAVPNHCVTDVKIDGVSEDPATLSTPYSYTFTNVTADHTIEAFFGAPFTITASAGANGSISPLGDITLCTGHSYTFTVTPDAGYCIDDVTVNGTSIFSPPETTDQFTVSAVTENKTIVASFREKYVFTGRINPEEARAAGGAWSLYGNDTSTLISGWQADGATVTLPCDNKNFTMNFLDIDGWTSPDPQTTDIEADVTQTGTYTREGYILTLSKTGEGANTATAGSGSLSGNPGGAAPGTYAYAFNDVVQLSAIPIEGNVFQAWTGGVADPLLHNTTVTMDAHKEITAQFAQLFYTLSLAKSGEGTAEAGAGSISGLGGGSAPGEYIYDNNDEVTLTAVPAEGWAFLEWTGQVADSSSATTTVTMDSGKVITAFFTTTSELDVDNDGDGWTENQGDCNDYDSSIYPGATEKCSDGIDQDCDGQDLPCHPELTDYDGDGYYGDDPDTSKFDCNDHDASIHPGAQEICEDGIDQDCDGDDIDCPDSDVDNDKDGFSINAGDCDDDDDDIYPGAPEICGDDIDQDCFDGDRACGSVVDTCTVDIDNVPLDTKIQAAPANIMFILDDSGSMDWEFIITGDSQGLFEGNYYIFDNPGDNAYNDSYIMGGSTRKKWKSQWAEHNKMYYDPTSTYDPWPRWNVLDTTEDDPGPSNPAFNADPDTPRSDPVYASHTFDFDAKAFCTLWEDGGQRVTVVREDRADNGGSTVADAIRLIHEHAPASVQVSSRDDDAEQYANGDMHLPSGDLDMVCDGYEGGAIGIRFQNVIMPLDWNAATNPITEAYIEFTAISSDSSVANLTITGEEIADAPVFTDVNSNITSRTRTAHPVAWSNIPAWSAEETGAGCRTPDITGIVNDIVTAGWTSGNSMVFIIEGTGCRRAYAYEGDSSKAPVLVLKTATSDDNAPDIIIDNKDELFISDGNWRESGSPNEHAGSCFYTSTVGDTATWLINIPDGYAGNYNVYAWVNEYDTRDQAAPYTVYHKTGDNTTAMDQRSQAAGGHGGEWFLLGQYEFDVADPTRNSTEIQRAHYYVWFDENTNGTWNNYDGDGPNDKDDDGEIYLIELDSASSSIKYYQFVDGNTNGVVDYGEPTFVHPLTKVPDEIQPNRIYAQERQNFANWYSFYRRRMHTSKSAIGAIIEDMSGVNMGILTINKRCKQKLVSIDTDGVTDQTDYLLGKLYDINSSGGTPLRQGLEYAGEYFKTGNLAGTVYDNPYYAPVDGGECQQSFAILMTDGYYCGGAPSVGNADKDTSADQEIGFDGLPYADDYTNTLADVAMHYYETDLSAHANKVPPNDTDPARHQHMVTYSVSFGVFGTLPGANPNCPNDCPWPNPAASSQHKIDDMFHAAVNGRGQYLSAEDPQTLSDAIKTLQQDMEQRIGSGASVAINSQELSEGTMLFKGTYDTNDWSGDIKAFSLYTEQEEADEIAEAEDQHRDPDPNIKAGYLKDTPKWSAAKKLSALDWADREIITFDRSVLTGPRGIPFSYSNLTNGQKFELGGYVDEAKAINMIKYFRGDESNEQPYGNEFRARGVAGSKFKSGDIVHSAPQLYNNVLYVGANDGMLHAFDATGDSTGGGEIFAYVPNLIFDNLNKLTVANPGYVHTYFVDMPPYIRTIDTSTDPDTTYLVGGLGKGGKGYYCLDISSISKTFTEADAAPIALWEYPYDATEGHLPFVEGNPHDFIVGDILDGSPSGASAEIMEVIHLSDDSGIFVLDNISGTFQEGENITNGGQPGHPGGSQAKVVCGLKPYDPDLGYSFSRAYIVRSGAASPNDWVVIFGNGYESPNGEAVLYVLKATDGTLLKKIRTGAGSATECNGLSSPAIIDVELDGEVDYAYAGDLKGNLWKFDLTSSDIANWCVAYNDGTDPQPLFTAAYNDGTHPIDDDGIPYDATIQPITIQPEVIKPCVSGQAGYLVLFGTGRHLGAADFADVSVQTMYGIWDWGDAWTSPSDKYLGTLMAPDTNGVRKLSHLDASVTTAEDVSLLRQSQVYSDADYRVLSDNTIDWFSPSDTSGTGADKHAGWYFDMPISSERVVREVVVRDGVFIIISSIPSTSQCAAGGDSILHEMDACTGGRLAYAQFDISGPEGVPDGIIDEHDFINIGSATKPIWVAPTGKKFTDMMVYTPAILELEKKDMKYFSTSMGTIQVVSEQAEVIGMTYWRDLP